jgi:hypothetical protein
MMTGYLMKEQKMIQDFAKEQQLKIRISNLTEALKNKDLNNDGRKVIEEDLKKSTSELVKVAGSRLPNNDDQLQFLEDMYQTFKDSSKKYSEKKGINIKTDFALFGGKKDEDTKI